MKFTKRIGVSACVALAAVLVAAGCGSDSSDGGASGGGGEALDLVPKTAVGYGVMDLDFSKDSWKQFEQLAGAFSADFSLTKEVGEFVDKNADYERDVKPWLGKSAGVAVTGLDIKKLMANDTAKSGAKTTPKDDGIEAFSWLELKDGDKYATFLKEQKYTESGTIGDYDVWTDAKNERYIGVSDDLAVTSPTKAQLTKVVNFDGDSIEDAEGVDDLKSDLEDDGLATVIVNGAAVRKLAKDNGAADLVADLDEYQGQAMQLLAEDKGLHVHSFSMGMKSEEKADDSMDLFLQSPSNSIMVLGGHDMGATLESGLTAVSKNKKYGATVTQLSALLGLDAKQIGDAFSGEFTLGLAGSDAGVQALIGSAVGALVSKDSKNLNAPALVKTNALTLAFAKGDETAETLQKLMGGASTLLRSPKGKTAMKGNFQTMQTAVRGFPLTVATSSDVAALSLGSDVFTTWGKAKLSDSAVFKDAWEAADAPDGATGSMWVDFARIAKLADLKGTEGTMVGGWVGWAAQDGDKGTIDVFMHVPKS